MRPKDADGVTSSVDRSLSDCHSWLSTVFSDPTVQILRTFAVLNKRQQNLELNKIIQHPNSHMSLQSEKRNLEHSICGQRLPRSAPEQDLCQQYYSIYSCIYPHTALSSGRSHRPES